MKIEAVRLYVLARRTRTRLVKLTRSPTCAHPYKHPHRVPTANPCPDFSGRDGEVHRRCHYVHDPTIELLRTQCWAQTAQPRDSTDAANHPLVTSPPLVGDSTLPVGLPRQAAGLRSTPDRRVRDRSPSTSPALLYLPIPAQIDAGRATASTPTVSTPSGRRADCDLRRCAEVGPVTPSSTTRRLL